MSTRSAIIRKRTDGKYEGIYCHFDGYEEGVGATLKEHYKTPEKVEQLISLGDISSLGEEIDGTESVGKEKGTTAYSRDRNEPYTEPRIGNSWIDVAEQIDHNQHVYVYDALDKSWTHYTGEASE